jgi:hypothetical protein
VSVLMASPIVAPERPPRVVPVTVATAAGAGRRSDHLVSLALAVGVVLWIPALFGQLRRNTPVHDPRTGRAITPGPTATTAAMSAFLAVLALACWGLAVLTT